MPELDHCQDVSGKRPIFGTAPATEGPKVNQALVIGRVANSSFRDQVSVGEALRGWLRGCYHCFTLGHWHLRTHVKDFDRAAAPRRAQTMPIASSGGQNVVKVHILSLSKPDATKFFRENSNENIRLTDQHPAPGTAR